MKVFELNHPGDEKEWIAANTNVEAILYYALVTGCDHNDLDQSTITEISEDVWDSILIRTESSLTDIQDGGIDTHIIRHLDDECIKDSTFTLKQWMEKTNPTSPEIIAGTMY